MHKRQKRYLILMLLLLALAGAIALWKQSPFTGQEPSNTPSVAVPPPESITDTAYQPPEPEPLVVTEAPPVSAPTVEQPQKIVPARETDIPSQPEPETVRSYMLSGDTQPVTLSPEPRTDAPGILNAARRSARRSRPVELLPELTARDKVSVGDEFILNLFDDAVYTARVDRITSDLPGGLNVRGRLLGFPLGHVSISHNAGHTLVSIHVPERNEQYTIMRDPTDNEYYLLDLDPEKIDRIESGPPLIPPPPSGDESSRLRNPAGFSIGGFILAGHGLSCEAMAKQGCVGLQISSPDDCLCVVRHRQDVVAVQC